MFSTEHLCKKYLFENKDDCLKRDIYPVNKSRINFTQTIFHIGTFDEFISITNEKDNNVLYTFKYIFFYLKKGIYVSIKNGKIEHYLPFSNINYKNSFNLPKDLYKLEINYNKNILIEKNPDKWYANNCFFRNTIDKKTKLFDEGDKSVAVFLILIQKLCKYKKIKDCKFFINPRDFPILHKHGLNPYYSLGNQKIIDPNLCITIFSQSINENYLDKLIPTEDDIYKTLHVIIPPGCNNNFYEKRLKFNWNDKKNIAIFRGSATGCSVTELANKRIQICIISKLYPTYIDAKLVSLNKRLKVDPNISFSVINEKRIVYDNIKIKDLLGSYMDDAETITYKYILNIDGHVSAFRLGRLLSFGSVILFIESSWIIWLNNYLNGIYYEDLKDIIKNNEKSDLNNIHYLKIKTLKNIANNTDTIDTKHLLNTISFLRKNDVISKIIANNCIDFYNNNLLNKKFLLKYFYNLIN